MCDYRCSMPSPQRYDMRWLIHEKFRGFSATHGGSVAIQRVVGGCGRENSAMLEGTSMLFFRLLGQKTTAGAAHFLIRSICRVFNGFSNRIWPIVSCMGRQLPLMGFFGWKFLRRESIHSDNSRFERVPCLLDIASLSDFIPKLSPQDLVQGLEHFLVLYGDLMSSRRSKFLETMEFWLGILT